MDTSQHIAGLAGPLLAAVAVAMLINPQARETILRAASDRSLIFFAGMLTLLAGLAIVRAHNVWDGSWRMLVTALGWASIAGGLARILMPEKIAHIREQVAGSGQMLTAWSLIALALGLFLTAKGYALI